MCGVRLLLLKDQGAYTKSISISPEFTNLLHYFTEQSNPSLPCWWIQTNIIEVHCT